MTRHFRGFPVGVPPIIQSSLSRSWWRPWGNPCPLWETWSDPWGQRSWSWIGFFWWKLLEHPKITWRTGVALQSLWITGKLSRHCVLLGESHRWDINSKKWMKWIDCQARVPKGMAQEYLTPINSATTRVSHVLYPSPDRLKNCFEHLPACVCGSNKKLAQDPDVYQDVSHPIIPSSDYFSAPILA